MRFSARLSKFMFVILSFAVVSSVGQASAQHFNDRATVLSQDDYDVYFSTIKKCSGTNRIRSLWSGMNFEVAASSATSVFKIVSIDTNAIFDFVENRGLSPEFSHILHSLGLYMALNDCYGDDDVAKQAYFVGLLLSDAAGKIGSLRVAFAALASIRGLTSIGKISPHALALFQAAGATGAIYCAYKTIYSEFQPRTKEEELRVESVQKQAFNQPLLYVDSAKGLISDKIQEIEQRLTTDLSSVERHNLQKKVEKLRQSLQEINDLEKKIS